MSKHEHDEDLDQQKEQITLPVLSLVCWTMLDVLVKDHGITEDQVDKALTAALDTVAAFDAGDTEAGKRIEHAATMMASTTRLRRMMVQHRVNKMH